MTRANSFHVRRVWTRRVPSTGADAVASRQLGTSRPRLAVLPYLATGFSTLALLASALSPRRHGMRPVGLRGASLPPRGLALASPGLRRPDPHDPTTALHQKYHDANIQYTVENLEWVERKGYSDEPALPRAERSAQSCAARERLRRWPRLLPQDTCSVRFRLGPQRFCPEGADGQALGDPAENVFVVSMPRRPQKLAHALQQLQAEGLAATVVSAMDGDALEARADLADLGARILPGYRGYSNHDMPFTTGEVGCFLSHYTIWHHMVEKQIPAALILEDDFDFQDDFSRRLGDCLLGAQGTEWNIMYIGRSPMENDVRQVAEHVVEPGYTLWTVGYVLKLEAAQLLLETHAEQHMVPLDDFFSVAMGCGRDGQYNEMAVAWSEHIPTVLTGLALNPPLVMPYVGAMFLSDTAMLRPRTRYVQDLPEESRGDLGSAAQDLEVVPPSSLEAVQEVGGSPPRAAAEPGQARGSPPHAAAEPGQKGGTLSSTAPDGIPSAWWEALEVVEAMQARMMAMSAAAWD